MKNTIKILCLILLTTFSLSILAIGGITFRPVQPASNYRVEPIRPPAVINPDPYRPRYPNEEKSSKSASPSKELTTEEYVQQMKKKLFLAKMNLDWERQKQEFIQSGAIQCLYGRCVVTQAGKNLLDNNNHTDYSSKFKAFIYNNPSIKIPKGQ